MPEYGYTGNIKLQIDDANLGKDLKKFQALLSKQLGKKFSIEVNFTTPAVKKSIAEFAKELERKINQIEFNPKINENFIKKMSKFEEKLAKDLNIKKSKWGKLAETRATKINAGKIQDPGKVYQRAIAEDYESIIENLNVEGIHSGKSDVFRKRKSGIYTSRFAEEESDPKEILEENRFQKEDLKSERKKTTFVEDRNEYYEDMLKALNNILDVNTSQLMVLDRSVQHQLEGTTALVTQEKIVQKQKRTWLDLINPLKWFNKTTKETTEEFKKGNEFLKKRAEAIDRSNKEFEKQNGILNMGFKQLDLINDSVGFINSKFLHMADIGMDFWTAISKSSKVLSTITPLVAASLLYATWTQKRYVQQAKTLTEIKKQTDGSLDANLLTRDAILAANKGMEDSISYSKRLNYQFNVSEDTLAKINDDVSKLGMIQMIGGDQVAYVRQFQKEVSILSQNIGENADQVSQWAYQLANVQNESDLSKVLDQISMFSSGAKYSTMSTQNFRDMIVGLTSDFDALGGNVEAATEFGMKFGAAMKKELGIADKNIARLMGTWEKGVEEMSDGAKLLVSQEFFNDKEVLKQMEKIDAVLKKKRRGEKLDDEEKKVVRQFGHLGPMAAEAVKQMQEIKAGKRDKIDMSAFALTIKNSMKDFTKFPSGMRKLAESQFKVIKRLAEQSGGEDIAGIWMELAKTMGAQSLEQQKLIANIGISGGTLEEMFAALSEQTGTTTEELQDQAKALKLNTNNAQALTKQQRSSVENLIRGMDLALSELGARDYGKALQDFGASITDSAEQLPLLKENIEKLTGMDFDSFKKTIESGKMTDPLKEGMKKVGKWVIENKEMLLGVGAGYLGYKGAKRMLGGKKGGEGIIGEGTNAQLEGGIENINEGVRNLKDQIALFKERTEEIGLGGKVGKWTGRTLGVVGGWMGTNKIEDFLKPLGKKIAEGGEKKQLEQLSKMSAEEFTKEYPGMTKEQAEEYIKNSQKMLAEFEKFTGKALGASIGGYYGGKVGQKTGDFLGKGLVNLPIVGKFIKWALPGVAKSLDPNIDKWRETLAGDLESGMDPQLAYAKSELGMADEQLTVLETISRNTGISAISGGLGGAGILATITPFILPTLAVLLTGVAALKIGSWIEKKFHLGKKFFDKVLGNREQDTDKEDILRRRLGLGKEAKMGEAFAQDYKSELERAKTVDTEPMDTQKMSKRIQMFSDKLKELDDASKYLEKFAKETGMDPEIYKRFQEDIDKMAAGYKEQRTKENKILHKRLEAIKTINENIKDADADLGPQISELKKSGISDDAINELFKGYFDQKKEINDKYIKKWEDEFKTDLEKLKKGEKVEGGGEKGIKTKEDLIKLHKDRLKQLKKGVILTTPDIFPEQQKAAIEKAQQESIARMESEGDVSKIQKTKNTLTEGAEVLKSKIKEMLPDTKELMSKMGISPNMMEMFKNFTGPIASLAGIGWDKIKETFDKLVVALNQFIKYISNPAGAKLDLENAYNYLKDPKQGLKDLTDLGSNLIDTGKTTGKELFNNIEDFLPKPQTAYDAVGNFYNKAKGYGNEALDYTKSGTATLAQKVKPYADATITKLDEATGDLLVRIKDFRKAVTPEVSKGIRDNERQKMQ
jgi:hypothetical protein